MALAVEEVEVVDATYVHFVSELGSRGVTQIARQSLGAVHSTEVDEEYIVHEEVNVVVSSEPEALYTAVLELRMVFEAEVEVAASSAVVAKANAIDREKGGV